MAPCEALGFTSLRKVPKNQAMSCAWKISNCMRVGPVDIPGRVWLAPMTGVSDLPFRRTATRLGAAYVATEMVACEHFASGRPDVIRRAAVGDGLPLMVVQLVGREPRWIAKGAELAVRAGAHIVDLNFGCPAKTVTGALCGSALMREPALARRLILAATQASGAPVTVKMRLGWDEVSINAAEFAAMAEDAGAKAITVHGRTRSQFYAGHADWTAVSQVKRATTVPVIVNGDIVDADGAVAALEASGADAIMIGRGAIGRPWIAAALDAELVGRVGPAPPPEALTRIVREQLAESLEFYGPALGLRMFRKHLAAYVEHAPFPGGTPRAREQADRRQIRGRLCRIEDPSGLATAIDELWPSDGWRLAA